jgi:hypothetical protein
MADYFLVLDNGFFCTGIRPALARSWQERRFTPLLALVRTLIPAALDYTRRYHTGPEEPLLCQVPRGLTFDRAIWRALAGEILLFAAVEMPEFPTDLDSLVYLLSGTRGQPESDQREQLPPIQQALCGSRDLVFGTAVYRPLHAGWNDSADVERLSGYLDSVQPEDWRPEDLAGRSDLEEADREDELEFSREWFPSLAGLYRRCQEAAHVIVIERVY